MSRLLLSVMYSVVRLIALVEDDIDTKNTGIYRLTAVQAKEVCKLHALRGILTCGGYYAEVNFHCVELSMLRDRNHCHGKYVRLSLRQHQLLPFTSRHWRCREQFMGPKFAMESSNHKAAPFTGTGTSQLLSEPKPSWCFAVPSRPIVSTNSYLFLGTSWRSCRKGELEMF